VLLLVLVLMLVLMLALMIYAPSARSPMRW
jgi:hypothetical protein